MSTDPGENGLELNSLEPGVAESGRRNRRRDANVASDFARCCSRWVLRRGFMAI